MRQVSWLLGFSILTLAGCANLLQDAVKIPATRPPVKSPGNGLQPASKTLETGRPVIVTKPTPGIDDLLPGSNVASIIGKLKSGPAGLISNNSASIIGDAGGAVISNNAGGLISNNTAGLRTLGAGFYRLLGIDESPQAGARIRWVDASGKALTDHEVTTDAEGRFDIPRPADASSAFLQARFKAGGVDVEYLALPPNSDEGSQAQPLVVDTASTLLTARIRENAQRGSLPARPGKIVLERLRQMLIPERVPFMGLGSSDVADAFDQLVNDDAELRADVQAQAVAVQKPARSWVVENWHTEDSLKASGALDDEENFQNTDTSRFEVDDEGNMYIVLGKGPARLVRIAPDGRPTTLADLPSDMIWPYALARTPNGTLIVGCTTTNNEAALLRHDGNSFTLLARQPHTLDGPDKGVGIARMAADDAGNVAIPVPKSNVILIRRPSSNRISVLAGTFAAGHRDGPAKQAQFNYPKAVSLAPDGSLYVADGLNFCIRRIDRNDMVTTVAGKPREDFSRFGRGQYARLGTPGGVAVAKDGTVFATDVKGRRVIRISPNGSVFLVAGTGAIGWDNGEGTKATFKVPTFLALDGQGNLYLQDLSTRTTVGEKGAQMILRKIRLADTASGPAGNASTGATDGMSQ